MKLWMQLYKNDIIGVVKIFTLVLILILIFFKLPKVVKKYTLSQLDSEAIGVVDSIKQRKGINESLDGGKVVVKDYKIDYHFQIKSKRINKSEIIDRSSITLGQSIKLNKIEKGDSILIRYDSKNLERSSIDVFAYFK